MLDMIANLLLFPAVVCGVLSLIAIRMAAPRLTAICLTVGVIGGYAASYIGFAGIPPFPPTSSVQKLFYAPILAGLLMVLCHAALKDAGHGIAAALSGVAALAGAAWILQRLLGRLDLTEWLLVLALVAALGLAAVTSLRSANAAAPARVAHGAAALGLGLALIFGGTATTGFFAIALAVAVGATLLVEIKPRTAAAGIAISAAFLVTIMPLAAQTLLLTDVSPFALLPLPACYMAIPIAQRLGWSGGEGFPAVFMNSVKTGLIAFPPALIAAAVSFTQGGGSPY